MHNALVWTVQYILALTVKRKISSMLKKWIRDDDDDGDGDDKKLREPRHKCQGIKPSLIDPDIISIVLTWCITFLNFFLLHCCCVLLLYSVRTEY